MMPTNREISTLSATGRALALYTGTASPARGRRRRVYLFGVDQVLNSLLIAGLVAIAAVAIARWETDTTAGTTTGLSAAVATSPFITGVVSKGDIQVRVSAVGTVEPVRLVEVSTEISGTIRVVHVENNDRVKAGQLLAELDSSTLRMELERATASVNAARAKLLEAEAEHLAAKQELGRKSSLAAKKLVSDRDLDVATALASQSKAAVEALRAELAAAEASRGIAEANLAKTRIVSPIDGIILRRNVEPGQTVAASLQAPVLFRLAQSLDRMQIRVDVDEADALQVRSGQRALFSVQALRDRQLEANVEKLFVGPEVVQGVVTYKAILSFDNSVLQLKPGMTASAEIVVENVHDALLVPNAALRFSPPDERAPGPALATGLKLVDSIIAPAGAKSPRGPLADAGGDGSNLRRVFVEEAGRLKPIVIGIGASDGNMTEVVSGPLREGQRVVVDLASSKK